MTNYRNFKTVAFVPAKGSSDRILNKNLAVMNGEFLFKHKLRQLLDCPLIDDVILDTDSDEIAEFASDLPIRRLVRPAHLATNATDGHELFAWECAQVPADLYIQALCTAPFVTADSLTRALDALLSAPEHDSLVAVTTAKHYLWANNEPVYGRGRIPNSVDLPTTTVEAMSLYICRASVLNTQKRFGTNPLLFPLSPMEAVDVNRPEDLLLAESIAAGVRAQDNLALGALAPYITSAMLSDITREMKLSLALPKAITGTGRFFGRAKTLLLDKPLATESWTGIFDALGSYQFVRPGDVVVVENRVPDHAYFGNLNAQLAMRSGAVGAVIDGVTRDQADVQRLGFPVFARGHYCVDIRFEGTVRAMNLPIEIGGVRIANNDYVFADSDGVVVLPATLWPEVKIRVLKGIEKEWRVGMAVALGLEASAIHRHLGDF
jgi:CMP-N-acetylneuraminic acid synthetase/regulator of RNase E activity RraA